MQPAGRHYRTDQRETDPVVVRAMKSPIVFSPQVGSQRPNSSKLMTIPSGKPQSAIYSNSRWAFNSNYNYNSNSNSNI